MSDGKDLFQKTGCEFAKTHKADRFSGERGGKVSPAFADAKGGEYMKPHSHEEHIQHSFDAFCKKVLRNEARDYLDELARRRNREISFSDLPVEVMEQFSTCDLYFVEDKTFGVLDYAVYIENDELAKAIAALPLDKRDVILLSYFLELSDNEIGKLLNMVRSSVTYRRTSTLKLLKELMGGNTDDT